MKNLKLLFLFFTLTFFSISNLSAQITLWVDGYGDELEDVSNSVVIDNDGNKYITGSFKSATLNFGSGIFVTNTGGWDMFVAKFDPSGNILWAESGTGSSDCNEFGNDLVVDDAGNVYVVGSFENNGLTFTGLPVLLNSGSSDFYVVCFDLVGTPLWSQTNISPTGKYDDYGEAIATNNTSVFIIGSFESYDLDFGGTTTSLSNSVSSGTSDIFIVEYSLSGTAISASNPVGIGNDYGKDIAVDPSLLNLFYITGSFESSSIDFGGTSTILTNTGGNDIFTAGYNTSTSCSWAKNPVGADNDFANGIAVDNTGNVYITGGFVSPSLTFGSLGSILNPCQPFNDFYIAKYDPSGTALWANSADANIDPSWNFDDVGNCLVLDNSGKLFVTGYYNSNKIDFGTGIITNETNNNYSEIFIAAFEASSGNNTWVSQPHEVFNDRGTGIDINMEFSSCPVVTGWYEDKLNFSGLWLSHLTPTEISDFYVGEVCNYDCNELCDDPIALLHTGYGLDIGNPDPNWLITSDPSGGTVPRDATVCRWHTSSWTYGSPFSETNYISIDTSANAITGTYTFQNTFFIDSLCFNPELSICILVDDTADVFLNGNYIGSASSFSTPSYIITSGFFVTGTNILTVEVENSILPQMALDIKGYVCCEDTDPCEDIYISYQQQSDSCCYDIYLENNSPPISINQITFTTESGNVTLLPDISTIPTGWSYSPTTFPSNILKLYPSTGGSFWEYFLLCLENDPVNNPQQINIEWMGYDANQDTLWCYDTLYLSCPDTCNCDSCTNPIVTITTGPGAPGTLSDWTLTSAPAGVPIGVPAINMGVIPSPWGIPFTGTNWISYKTSGGGGSAHAPYGIYNFVTEFFIQDTCQNFQNMFMQICVMVDDTANLYLNGTYIGTATSESIPWFRNDITAPFILGLNTLEVEVINSPAVYTGFDLLAWICCDDNTGISTNDLNNKIKIYPNPASDHFIINSTIPIKSFDLFNSYGQLITSKVQENMYIKINTTSYDPGLYLIRLNTTKGIITKKIMIK